MSILIKGLKMPEDGCKDCLLVKRGRVFDICPFLKREVNGNVERGGKPYGCPLIELPDHGDLVDRDEFIGRLQSWALLIATGHGDDDEWVKCIGEVCDHLYDAPVVIPAERRESDGET